MSEFQGWDRDDLYLIINDNVDDLYPYGAFCYHTTDVIKAGLVAQLAIDKMIASTKTLDRP